MRGQHRPAARRAPDRQKRSQQCSGGLCWVLGTPMPLCLKAPASMRDECPLSVQRYGRYRPRLRASRTVRFPNDVVFQDHIKQGDLEQVGRFIRARKVTLDTIYPSGECCWPAELGESRGTAWWGCEGHRGWAVATSSRTGAATSLPSQKQGPAEPKSPRAGPQHLPSTPQSEHAVGRGSLASGSL